MTGRVAARLLLVIVVVSAINTSLLAWERSLLQRRTRQ